ncbi:hypothetical protein F2P81_009694 [Scophthalmus maximus]|uniref:Uncharacterized protein n=1 Tax=Scophthalmus maximus TaxID=52904 RepID=A0A6A4SYA2_SCOMX|nr:hypothetical protein F2P81_009694 [Scophthalmus maximus]
MPSGSWLHQSQPGRPPVRTNPTPRRLRWAGTLRNPTDSAHQPLMRSVRLQADDSSPVHPYLRLFSGVRAGAMVSHSLALPMICFTTLWALVGVVAPFLVPKGPNRGFWFIVGYLQYLKSAVQRRFKYASELLPV